MNKLLELDKLIWIK